MAGVLALAALALALGLVACGGGGATPGGGTGGAQESGGSASKDKNTWVHGVLTPKGDAGYFLMAQEREFFEKQGVNVQIKQFVGNVQLVQALVSGAIDSGDTAPGPIYAASLKGAGVKIIGSTLPTITYALFAKDDIKSFKDLEGKTIGVSAPGSFPEEVVRAMMAKEGLDPKDIKIINAGNDAQRVQALFGGRIDAVANSVEWVPMIDEKPGFHVLAKAQDVIPNFPRFYLMGNEKSLEAKPEAAAKFMAGQMQGVCYAVQNPDAEKEVTGGFLKKPPSDPQIVEAQKEIADAGAASPTMAIPMDKLEYLQKVRMDVLGSQDEPVDFSQLVDKSVREKALQMADLPSQCQDDPNAQGAQ